MGFLDGLGISEEMHIKDLSYRTVTIITTLYT